MYDKTHNLPEQPPDNRLTLGETIFIVVFMFLIAIVMFLIVILMFSMSQPR